MKIEKMHLALYMWAEYPTLAPDIQRVHFDNEGVERPPSGTRYRVSTIHEVTFIPLSKEEIAQNALSKLGKMMADKTTEFAQEMSKLKDIEARYLGLGYEQPEPPVVQPVSDFDDDIPF